MAGRLLTRLPELTGCDPAGIDPARGGVIDVPDRFVTTDLEAAARAGDPLLVDRLRRPPTRGRTVRSPSTSPGVPELLNRYEGGDGGNPYGQAVIAAAIDATRLGHASRYNRAPYLEAAVGYLTGRPATDGFPHRYLARDRS